MDKTRIDGQKLDMHPWRVAAWLNAMDDWEKAREIFPIYMEVSPIGSCIHECTFCSVDYMLDRTDHPSFTHDVMTRTLSDMAAHGVLSTMFAGCGEPLSYRDRSAKKDLADAILHANAVGIDTSVTTNAVLLSPEFSERAFTAQRLRWIRTSINGGNEETYTKIHRCHPSHFERVLRNLEAAVKIRERLGSRVKLFAQLVALPEAEGMSRRSLVRQTYPSNIPTIVPLARRLRDIGVDNFSVKPFKQHLVEHEATRSKMYEAAGQDPFEETFLELEGLETDAFEITVRREAMVNAGAEDRGYGRCHATPFHWAYIEADGEVWGCSAYVGRIDGDRILGDHRFRFGNVNKQSFPEIWRGERRRRCWEYTRKPPSEGGLNVNACMRGCQMDMPNRYLWELAHPELDPTRTFIK